MRKALFLYLERINFENPLAFLRRRVYDSIKETGVNTMAKKAKTTALIASQISNQKAAAESDKKLTIYEYEQKYSRRQNVRGTKFLLRFLAAIIGLFLFTCLFFLTYHVWEINEYAGYAVGGVCLILYIVFFIVPLCKIMRTDYFHVNVNAFTAKEAKKHNKKLRHEIADKIIDFTASVEGVGWYDSQIVGQLAIASKRGDEAALKQNLSLLYAGSVKRSAHDLIMRNALKSATYSAVSQTSLVDSALVIVVNLQLIKDLVFLYGFRPSDGKLMKIFGRVLKNSLVAYGLSSMQIGNTVVRSMGDVVKGIPILGSAIASLVDSSVQGLSNGVLTAVIGFQTINYLNKEYKLQDILDNVELTETEEELAATCTEIEKELRREKEKRGKKTAPAI